jgi:hypothetical protein
VYQSIRLRLQFNVDHIAGSDVKFDAGIREAFAETKQIRGIDIHDDCAVGDGRVDMFQSVACRATADEHHVGSNNLKGLAQQTAQDRSLIHGRAAHVTHIVGFRNIKPRIIHPCRAHVTV